MNRQIRRALAAALTVPVLALGACGSDDMSGMDHGGSGTTPAASAPATSTASAANPADVMFATMMIPHHEQAVQMSTLLLAKEGVDPDVRRLAQEITAAQQPEIAQMQGWLSAWGVDESSMNGMDHSDHMEGMLTPEQLQALEKADGPTGQRLYLQGMIAHHEGAVTMAESVLGVTSNPEVRQLAETIVRTQQAEITRMRSLLGG